jgi:peroxisomal 2,4-dienoyl-CoA reductase
MELMPNVISAKGLAESAEKLSKATGQTCLPASADVRDPEALKAAVALTKEKFGRIDFVICGMSSQYYLV